MARFSMACLNDGKGLGPDRYKPLNNPQRADDLEIIKRQDAVRAMLPGLREKLRENRRLGADTRLIEAIITSGLALLKIKTGSAKTLNGEYSANGGCSWGQGAAAGKQGEGRNLVHKESWDQHVAKLAAIKERSARGSGTTIWVNVGGEKYALGSRPKTGRELAMVTDETLAQLKRDWNYIFR